MHFSKKKYVSKLRTDNLGKRMLHHFEEEKNQSNLHQLFFCQTGFKTRTEYNNMMLF